MKVICQSLKVTAMNKRSKYIVALTGLCLSTSQLSAQSAGALSSADAFYIVSGFVFIISLLVLAVAVVVLRLLKIIVRQESEKLAQARGVELVEPESWWSKLMKKANDAVPLEEEDTVMLDHNYDGIRELDNHLPPWWKWMFYLSIVFGVVYMLSYHVIGNMPLQLEEYQAQMEVANAEAQARLANMPQAEIDESNVPLVDDPTALAQGKKVYLSNCSQCHKELGEGGIGPNLTDDYWLHGGDISSVYVSIKNGIPEKGMIAWEPLLSPTQMQNVASYILTLRGTNPPNAKAPQGELFVPLDKEEVEEVLEGQGVEADTMQVAVAN